MYFNQSWTPKTGQGVGGGHGSTREQLLAMDCWTPTQAPEKQVFQAHPAGSFAMEGPEILRFDPGKAFRITIRITAVLHGEGLVQW